MGNPFLLFYLPERARIPGMHNILPALTYYYCCKGRQTGNWILHGIEQDCPSDRLAGYRKYKKDFGKSEEIM